MLRDDNCGHRNDDDFRLCKMCSISWVWCWLFGYAHHAVIVTRHLRTSYLLRNTGAYHETHAFPIKILKDIRKYKS